MAGSREVVACPECGVFWFRDAEDAKCTVVGHQHRQHQVHLHRDLISLPDGTEVIAASFDPVDRYRREHRPDFGCYLDPRWQPPWPHQQLEWPDFGVPTDATKMRSALTAIVERARTGDVVEIGCLGGHGRTGVALACLAVLTGESPDTAVAWVRANYCADAVETEEQERFVAGW